MSVNGGPSTKYLTYNIKVLVYDTEIPWFTWKVLLIKKSRTQGSCPRSTESYSLTINEFIEDNQERPELFLVILKRQRETETERFVHKEEDSKVLKGYAQEIKTNKKLTNLIFCVGENPSYELNILSIYQHINFTEKQQNRALELEYLLLNWPVSSIT